MERSSFTNRFGFIAAAAGSAIGLGNIWKFPFETGKSGGAAFLVVYLVFVFILCLPILITEIAIGRGAQHSAAGAFKALNYPKWSFIGIISVTCSILILSFYNIVAGWVFGYFIEMVKGNYNIGKEFPHFVKDIYRVGLFSGFFMIFTAFIVSRGITKGIERASKVMMPILLGILIFLVIYAMTLPNAMAGLEFYLIPDFSKINIEVIYRALGQGFFSLSLGMGTMLTYGSYVKKQENLITSGLIITLSDFMIAFLAGLMIFPMVFSQGISTSGGSGLVFITMPGVFGTMGLVWGRIVGSLFFLLLAFAALTSTISLLELPVSFMVDSKKMDRGKAAWISALLVFLVSIPSMMSNGFSAYFTRFIRYVGSENTTDFMSLVTDVSSNTLLPLGGFLLAIFAMYTWKSKNMFNEISSGYPEFNRSWIRNYLEITLKFIAPVMLGLIFIITVLEIYFGIKIF